MNHLEDAVVEKNEGLVTAGDGGGPDGVADDADDDRLTAILDSS